MTFCGHTNQSTIGLTCSRTQKQQQQHQQQQQVAYVYTCIMRRCLHKILYDAITCKYYNKIFNNDDANFFFLFTRRVRTSLIWRWSK